MQLKQVQFFFMSISGGSDYWVLKSNAGKKKGDKVFDG